MVGDKEIEIQKPANANDGGDDVCDGEEVEDERDGVEDHVVEADLRGRRMN